MKRISDYCKRDKINFSIGVIIFATMSYLGMFYDIAEENSMLITFIRGNCNSVIIIWLSLVVAFWLIIKTSIRLVDSAKSNNAPAPITQLRINKGNWIRITILFLALWIPYLIIFFPGTYAGLDYFWQLMQGCGALPLSNHHPVFGSLVFGFLYRVGYAVGGAEGGLFFSVLFQVLLMTGVLGFCLSELLELGMPRCVGLGIIAFLGVCPTFPTHALWLVKDSIFSSIAVLFFFSCYLHIYGTKRNVGMPRIAGIVSLAVQSILLSIYRNGVSIITIVLVGMVIIVDIKNKKGIEKNLEWLAIVGIIISITAWGSFLNKLDVFPTNFTESVGIPGRQILKTYELRPEKFSNEDVNTLRYIYRSSIENGRSLEDIVEANDHKTADNIKPSRFETDKDIAQYIKLWAKIGLENPEIYIDEGLRSTNAYWWVGYNPEEVYISTPMGQVNTFFDNYEFDEKTIRYYFGPIPASLEDSDISLDMTMEEHLRDYPEVYEFTQLKSKHGKAIEALWKIMAYIRQMPVISILLTPGFYTWVLLACLLYMSLRKNEGRFLWPVTLIIALACLSPINGYMRYVLPTNIFSIIMTGICFIPQNQEECDSPIKSNSE